jgi:hypothetical protein
MFPTVDEQLHQIRRILTDIVAPEVQSSYPADTLREVIASLEMLERGWDQVLPFLAWDNQQTVVLLSEALPLIDGELAARIQAATTAPAATTADAHRRNLELRALLADAVPRLTGHPEPYRRVTDHLRQRLARYPFTPAPR